MKRITMLMALIVAIAGSAAASNGQEKILKREINDMLLINSEIQGTLERCEERVCVTLRENAEDRAEILGQFDTIDNAPEEKERGLNQVRDSVREDINTLEKRTQAQSEFGDLIDSLNALDKDSSRALRAANTLGVIKTAKECPEKCGPSVSQQAREAQDYNSSRSNKPSK